jgi:Excalibur calcium-binding domain
VRTAAPIAAVACAAVLAGCGSSTSTSLRPLADVPSISATATTSPTASPTTTPSATTPAVAAGAGVGYGSGADEAIARRGVRAAVPTTTRRTTSKPPTSTKAATSKTTAKKTTEKPASAYYKNCAAVRAAGKAPIHIGEPGYAKHLDRDGDGVGCE